MHKPVQHTPVPAPIRRVARSKEKARANYNRLSRWYDIIAGSTEKKYRDVGLQKLAARPGEHILEIGFGTGHCILALAQAVGESGQVCGIDLSEGMLTITQDRLRQAGLLDRVDLRVGDAAKLPFAEGEFDGVFMSFTLELFDSPEIPVVLKQCYEVLKSGGRLAVVALVKQPGTAVKIYEWFHEKMPVAVDCRPIYAQADLTAAGFHIQDVAAMSMWGLPVEIILAQKGGSP
ncbi:MAG: 2-heptaprenyl-1,4-naphthoquinone methyltransferase [Anaerolineaceae bacterium]|nr:2-heptaprenyl-1,4-naphthoquinone methyltransferase [Anaerolineaceae bacterium]